MATREQSAALATLDPGAEKAPGFTITESDARQIITHWLMGESGYRDTWLPVWQNLLQSDRDEAGNFR